ncbi:MAG: sarcosine oxidase [Alphaproteobacteria bacterium]
MGLAPESLSRRSYVYRELVGLGAAFAEINGAACAMRCGASIDDEAECARELAICDLSPLPRAGFKGRETIAWLAAHGVAVSATNNMTVVQDDGARAARLADGEVLLLSDLAVESNLCARLAVAWSPDPDPGAYPVPRADTNCWFLIPGRRAAEMLAKVCGVDLRPHKFPDGAIAQTSVARLNAIVLRGDLGDTLAFHLLTDSASASYMWESLLDAMDEFDGRPVGLAAVRMLAASGTP